MPPHVLRTAEIAQVVLEHLDPGPLLEDEPTHSIAVKERRERQHALAQLATVCRDVSWIALDVLWRHIDAVHHLLFALRPYHHHQHMFTDSIEDEDWTRFQEYAQRVRGLHLGDVKALHATVWVALTQRCPRGPLLPRLENLAEFMIDTSSVCYTMFMSPSLKRLGLIVCWTYGERDSVIQMTVRAIQPSLHSIQHLVVNDSTYTDGAVSFWELTQLHTLQVEGPNGCALRMRELACLGSFQHLRKLHMRLASITALEEPTATGMGFHSLRELKLYGRLGDICAFIAAATPPALESLSIHTRSLCEYEDPIDVPHVQSVRPNGGRSLGPIYAQLTPSLRRFEASLICSCRDFSHLPDSDALLAPLQAVPDLRSISFVFQTRWLHLGNETLAALRDAWPDLAEFGYSMCRPEDGHRHRSGYRYRSRSRSPNPAYPGDASGQVPSSSHGRLTVQTLAVFAQAHPHLSRLAVPSLDLHAVPDIDTVPPLDHRLEHFSVSGLESDIALFPFARALDMLFPRLDLSCWAGFAPSSQNRIDRNAELQLLLLALQTGRRVGAAGHASRPSTLSATAMGKRPTGRDAAAIRLVRQASERARSPRMLSRTRSTPSPRSRDRSPRRPRYNLSPPPPLRYRARSPPRSRSPMSERLSMYTAGDRRPGAYHRPSRTPGTRDIDAPTRGRTHSTRSRDSKDGRSPSPAVPGTGKGWFARLRCF